MASSGLQDFTECSICLDSKVDPKQLACQHSYCCACLEPYALLGRIKCPECRCDTPLPPGGVRNLPADFRTNQLMLALSQQQKEDTTMCANCLEPQVKYLCKTCHDYLCETCGRNHKKLAVFRDHELVLSQKCQKHPKKDRLYTCTDCQEIICISCVMAEHKQHAVENVNRHIEARQGLLEKLLHNLEAECCQKITAKINKTDLQKVEGEIQEKFASIKTQIDDAAACSIRIIKQEQSKLLASLDVDLKFFEKWVATTKDAELLASRVEELRESCDPYLNATGPAGRDVLDGITSLTPQVRTMLGQIKDTHLSSFTSLSLPKSFSAASPELGLGTVIYSSEPSNPISRTANHSPLPFKDRPVNWSLPRSQSIPGPMMHVPSVPVPLMQAPVMQRAFMGNEMKMRPYKSRHRDDESTHNSTSEEQKSDNRQIFVGNIPKNLDEAELMQFFRRYGQVISVRIIPVKMQSENYGFITFKEEGMARAVLNSQHELVLRTGHHLKVKPNKHTSSKVTDKKPHGDSKVNDKMQHVGKRAEHKNPSGGNRVEDNQRRGSNFEDKKQHGGTISENRNRRRGRSQSGSRASSSSSGGRASSAQPGLLGYYRY